jgi:hypothetical protein
MKTRLPFATLIAFALSALTLVAVASPWTADASGKGGRGCNSATLKGAYAFDVTGWVGSVEAPFDLDAGTYFAPPVVSRFTYFDGKGNWEGRGYTVAGGDAKGKGDEEKWIYNATYTVYDDEYKNSLNSVADLSGVIVVN